MFSYVVLMWGCIKQSSVLDYHWKLGVGHDWTKRTFSKPMMYHLLAVHCEYKHSSEYGTCSSPRELLAIHHSTKYSKLYDVMWNNHMPRRKNVMGRKKALNCRPSFAFYSAEKSIEHKSNWWHNSNSSERWLEVNTATLCKNVTIKPVSKASDHNMYIKETDYSCSHYYVLKPVKKLHPQKYTFRVVQYM